MELKEYKELYDAMVLDDEADKRILDGIKQRKEKTIDKKYYKSAWRAVRAAVALLAVIITGVAAYAATQLWNSNVANEFGVSDKPEIMDKISGKGFSQYIAEGDNGFSITDNGITISIIQTLADKNCAYVYFEADFGDKYTAVGDIKDIAYPVLAFKSDVEGIGWAGGATSIINQHKVAYSYHMVSVGKGNLLENPEIEMKISSFVTGDEANSTKRNIVAEGEWDFKWNLPLGTERRVYTINKTINIMGFAFKLKKFEISPLSYSITIEEDGWDKKERKEFYNMQESDSGFGGFVTGINLGDNTFGGIGGMGALDQYEDRAGNVFLKELVQFSQILDLDKVTSISCWNDEIFLKDYSYTIVK